LEAVFIVVEPLTAAVLGGFAYEVAKSAIAKWIGAQIAEGFRSALDNRELGRGRPVGGQQKALATVLRAAVAQTAIDQFPEDRLRAKFRRTLLKGASSSWPLVDGSALEDLVGTVYAWITKNDPPPSSQQAPGDHLYLALLCGNIIAQFGFRAENSGKNNMILYPRWDRFWTTELLTRIVPQSHDDLEPTGPSQIVLESPESESVIDVNVATSALRDSVRRHERRAGRVQPQIGLIQRPETERALSLLREDVSKQVVLVDGAAGWGKSAVVTDIASSLEADGWVVAFTRMDGAEEVHNAQDIGKQMELDDSPVTAMACVAAGRPALLVIDQLDAVSELSGRVPDSFEAVDEILAEVKEVPNIRVLLACRTVDLTGDPRLRSLLHGEDAAGRVQLELLDPDQVQTHFNEHQVHVPQGAVLELLRTPLHLAVYCRLEPASQQAPYRTLPDLYEQFTKEVRSRLARRVDEFDWETVTSTAVDYMSEHEVLTVPSACLDPLPVQHVEAMVSETVLVRGASGFSFFHQTYFDYLFARSFIRKGEDLYEFVVSSSQALFRRAPTRQILNHLATTDRSAYRDQIVRILSSEEVRFHLKDVIMGDMRVLDATGEDWAAVEPLIWGQDPAAAKLRSLLNVPAWFDAADSLGCWERWLSDPTRLDVVYMEFVLAAKDRGKRVAELLRPFVSAGAEWPQRLRSLFFWSLTPDLVEFGVELTRQGLFDYVEGETSHSDFWSLLYVLEGTGAPGAARLIGAFLARGLERARGEGHADPFASGHLENDSTSAGVIGTIAEIAPAAFVHEVLPFVIDVAMADQRTTGNQLPYGSRWKAYREDAIGGIDEQLFAAAEAALVSLMKSDPHGAVPELDRLRDAESRELRFLVCRALTEGEDAGGAVEWLLADPRNFLLGWTYDPYWAAAHLLKAHSPNCAEDLFRQVEGEVLRMVSPFASPHGDRYGQYILLESLDSSRLSEAARRLRGELERRFNSPPRLPERGWHFEDEGAPRVPSSAAMYMSDDDWLRAFRKHYDAKADRYLGLGAGKARQFAELLEKRTREEPERFANLALQFDSTIPIEAIANVLRSLAAEDNLDLFSDVCHHAIRVYGDQFGWSLPSAINDLTTGDHRIVNLIAWCAASADPATDPDLKTQDRSKVDIHGTGRLLDIGYNTTRGQAALTAHAMLFKAPDQVDRLAETIGKLARDPHLAVRACAAEAVNALIKLRPELGIELAAELLTELPEVLDAYTTQHLLVGALRQSPQRFAPHLAQSLTGPAAVAGRAGRIWAFYIAQDTVAPPLTTQVQQLPAAARLGAADQFAHSPTVNANWLPTLFNDLDPEIRAQAAQATRKLDGIRPAELEQLTAAFIDSEAFSEHLNHLMYGLAKLGTRLPSSALAACAKAVQHAGRDLGNLRTAHAGASRYVITVVLRLYHQSSSAEARAECLDIIDGLCAASALGVTEALADER
jgi:hypothetical protein